MEITTFHLEESDKLEDFYSLQWNLYTDNPGYVKQVNLIDTIAFETGFILIGDGNTLARGVVYRTQLRMEGKEILFLGNFEALTLEHGLYFLKNIKPVLKRFLSGMLLLGPINGSTWNNYRLSVGENSCLFPGDISNPSFYPDVFEQAGFSFYAQYYTQVQTSFSTDLKIPLGYSIQYLNKNDWIDALEIIYTITMAAFAKAPLFSKITYESFRKKYVAMLISLDTNLMPLVLDENSEIVGYAVAYLSPFDNSMTAKTIARKAGIRYAGVGRLLSAEIMQLAKKYKVDKLYHAFMHQDNSSKALSAKYNAVTIKQYRLYKISL